jgi:hypothetical protein
MLLWDTALKEGKDGVISGLDIRHVVKRTSQGNGNNSYPTGWSKHDVRSRDKHDAGEHRECDAGEHRECDAGEHRECDVRKHVLKYDLELTFGNSPLVITRKSIRDILAHYKVTLALAVVLLSDQYLVAEHTSKTAE